MIYDKTEGSRANIKQFISKGSCSFLPFSHKLNGEFTLDSSRLHSGRSGKIRNVKKGYTQETLQLYIKPLITERWQI